jgi:hypothetical protein
MYAGHDTLPPWLQVSCKEQGTCMATYRLGKVSLELNNKPLPREINTEGKTGTFKEESFGNACVATYHIGKLSLWSNHEPLPSGQTQRVMNREIQRRNPRRNRLATHACTRITLAYSHCSLTTSHYRADKVHRGATHA